MSVRAKFRVTEVTHTTWSKGAIVHMQAVYSTDPNHENKAFFEATPDASLRMHINNPEAANVFGIGKEYYLDFTEAPATTE